MLLDMVHEINIFGEHFMAFGTLEILNKVFFSIGFHGFQLHKKNNDEHTSASNLTAIPESFSVPVSYIP